MHSVRCERRNADRDILGPFRIGRAVANPFAAVRHYGLTRPHLQNAAAILHSQYAAQHNRELIEFGLLSRLAPSRRTTHMGNADCRSIRVHMADVFIQKFVSGNWNASRSSEQSRHAINDPAR